MAVRRARKTARRQRRPPRTISRVTGAGFLRFPDSPGRDPDLYEAAKIVADGARDLAGSWSVKIPASIYTTVDGNVATIHAAAPNARPAEFRLRHPLFGNRRHWFGPPGEPFLAPALDARIDPAMKRYADAVDTYAKKQGWT